MTDSRALILMTIDEMVERGEKLSVVAVARRCGLSHPLIYSRYPDLKDYILARRQHARVDAESGQRMGS